MSVINLYPHTTRYTDHENNVWALVCQDGDYVMHMPNGEEIWLSESAAMQADRNPLFWLRATAQGILWGTNYGH